MTHIKGYQELLLAGAMGKLTPEQENTINIIKNSSERLEKLIEDLISFSQISKGEISLKQSRVDIAAITKNITNHNLIKAQEKNITLKYDGPEVLPSVFADEQKISWVIIQLLDNALKFTPEYGKIDVLAQAVDLGVLISIQDTGIGIPADKVDVIFEPFHQLDGNSTRRYGGTGLGLSLVKQIIEAHNSKVIVTSEMGKFSRFEFILPITN